MAQLGAQKDTKQLLNLADKRGGFRQVGGERDGRRGQETSKEFNGRGTEEGGRPNF